MKIEILEDAIIINDQRESLPVSLNRLTEIIGRPNRKKKSKYNTIYTWDDLGIHVYSKDGRHIEAIDLKLNNREGYDFIPQQLFAGAFNIAGVDYTERMHLISAANHIERFGLFSIFYLFEDDSETVTGASISLYKEPKPLKDPHKYKFKEIEDEPIQFTDFNFKLAVVNILMYDEKLLEPAFDVYEFVERYKERKIDIEEEGYNIIPEVKEYFEKLQVSKRFASRITEIIQDGGEDIYAQLYPFWDGEDDIFNIRSAEDIDSFPNLKKMVLFFDKDPKIYNEIRDKGIEVDWL